MDLKDLLGEELYNQVIEKAGDSKIAIVSDGNWFPKDKFNTVNEDNKELKKQLKERDLQLNELSKIDADGLQTKIQELQTANEQAKTEYEQKLTQQQFDFALKEALTGAKVKNTKAVEALLNKEIIKLDGEKLLGLDEQIKNLQESDAYLFDVQTNEPPKPQFSGGQHNPPANGDAFTSVLLGQ